MCFLFRIELSCDPEMDHLRRWCEVVQLLAIIKPNCLGMISDRT